MGQTTSISCLPCNATIKTDDWTFDNKEEDDFKVHDQGFPAKRIEYKSWAAVPTPQQSLNAGLPIDLEDKKTGGVSSVGHGEISVAGPQNEKIEVSVREKPSQCSRKRFVINLPSVCEKLHSLNWTGTITHEKANKFWAIKMDQSWQDIQDELVEIVKKENVHKDFLENATSKAEGWKELLKSKWLDTLGSEAIGFFTPTSNSGMHVTLGKFETETKPDCLVEGKKVSLAYRSCSTIESNGKIPVIYPGQREVYHSNQEDYAPLMHCTTQWYLLDVEVMDFDFPFRWPPHITLAAYGLKYVPIAEAKKKWDNVQ